MKQIDPWVVNLNVLGLPKESEWKEVQARYRRLVLSLHPDINRGDIRSADRFRAVARAYERLKELKREREAQSVEHFGAMSEDPRLSALSIDELGMRIRYSHSPRVRAAAAYLLGQIESKESRQLLLVACRDPEANVRGVAHEVLVRVGTPADLLRCIVGPGRKRWRETATLLLHCASRCARVVVQPLRMRAARSGSGANSLAWGR